MTRETKIGLVLGLGFIVVFGILLSNRGAGEHLPPPASSGAAPIVPPEILLTDDLDPPTQPGDVEEAAEPSTDLEIVTVDEANTAGDIELPVIGPGMGVPQPVAGVPAEVQVAALEPTPEATAPNRTPVSASALNVATQTSSSRAIPVPVRASLSAPGLPVRLIEHRIMNGDTLSRLARLYYGTAVPDAINAIYVANRSVLRKGPHDLKLNQQLTIPAWAPAEKFEPAPTPPAAQVVNRRAGAAARNPLINTGTGHVATVDTPNALSSVVVHAPATAASGVAWDWYEMGPNETLYGVAAKRLGSPRRWREIHELNKSDHPDPRRIRMGTRIKLPRT